MGKIEGSVIKSDGTTSTSKDAYIDYTITQSVANNNSIVNVKSYFTNLSGVSGPAISNQTSKLKYDGANEYSNVVNYTAEQIPVGTSVKMSETNYTISHSASGKAKNITLYAYSPIAPGTIADHMLVEGTITLPKISNGNLKVSGLWKTAFFWIKVLGVWKRAIVWKKISGIWKKGK